MWTSCLRILSLHLFDILNSWYSVPFLCLFSSNFLTFLCLVVHIFERLYGLLVFSDIRMLQRKIRDMVHTLPEFMTRCWIRCLRGRNIWSSIAITSWLMDLLCWLPNSRYGMVFTFQHLDFALILWRNMCLFAFLVSIYSWFVWCFYMWFDKFLQPTCSCSLKSWRQTNWQGEEKCPMWFWIFQWGLQPHTLHNFWVCHRELGLKQVGLKLLEKELLLGLLTLALILHTPVLLMINLNILSLFLLISLAPVRLLQIFHPVLAIGSLLGPDILQLLL